MVIVTNKAVVEMGDQITTAIKTYEKENSKSCTTIQ